DVAAGGGVVRRRVAEIDRGVEADEGRAATSPADPKGFGRGADRSRLSGVRVDADLGGGDARFDVVRLRLDGREVVLRSALEDVARPELCEARDLDHVLPYVLREDHREPRKEFLL